MKVFLLYFLFDLIIEKIFTSIHHNVTKWINPFHSLKHKTYRSIRYKSRYPSPSIRHIEGIREERIIYNATIIYSSINNYTLIHNYDNDDILEYQYFVPDNKLHEFMRHFGRNRNYGPIWNGHFIDTQICKNVFSRKFHTRDSFCPSTYINKDLIIAIEE